METALNLGNANVISVLWVIVVKWLVTVMDIQIVLVANKERNVWNVKITLWEINANTASKSYNFVLAFLLSFLHESQA